MTPSHDPPGHGFVDLTLEPAVGRVKQRQRRPIIRCVLPYSSNTATARIGEPVPPRHLSGKPMKRNSPWPISASRLHRLSICVMSSSRHALCTSEFTTDRKSTRLNSSHSQISYAVFCLKKKNNK